MSELLNKQINCAIGLRKLTSFQLEETNNQTYPIRPQVHLLLVKPFGGIKSGYSYALEKALGNDLVKEDDFTKASLMGTIGKNGNYVPGIVNLIGGKVLLVDEFNNLNLETCKALLPILENQRVERSLGFAIKKLHATKNEWTNLTVKQGRISGHINFSCIMFAMEWPSIQKQGFQGASSQSLLGLKSRFMPNFSASEIKSVMDGLRGIKPFELKDVGVSPVRQILIERKAYSEFMDKFEEMGEKLCGEEDDNTPLNNSTLGFLTRAQRDILRFTAHDLMGKLPANFKGKELRITESEPLIKNAETWLETILEQYVHEEKAGDYNAFLRLKEKHPSMLQRIYAQKLNVTARTIERWVKKWKESQPLLKNCAVAIGLTLWLGLKESVQYLDQNLDAIMETVTEWFN